MFIYGDLVTNRHNYTDAIHNVYMFVQNICIDPKHCVCYDIRRNELVFKNVHDLVSRKRYIGNNSLKIDLLDVANSSVRYQLHTYIKEQQEIAKQKFVFLRNTLDRGITLRVNGRHYRPTDVYFRPNNYVYWQDMIVFTGYKQVGHTDDILLSTLLPNCLYLQQLVEID